jgi:NAD(P)-dependent dehydrogenase (short-subunit alcohol dehydrogenase family)
MTTQQTLTANDTIAAWWAHTEGHDVITGLLGGPTAAESVLGQVKNLPLSTLAQMSQGRITSEMVDDAVRAVNNGELPVAAETPAPTQRFAGKTVIVTGAASGIGRATAERILREGGRVVGVDMSAEGLTALEQSAQPGRVVAIAGDITKEDDVARIVAASGEVIDGLANVAGIMDGMVPLHEVTDDLWDRVFAVNVTGSFLLSRAVVSKMLDRGQGSIVNVASEAALRGNAAGTAYTVSKHAVVGLTRSTAFLYGSKGIRTNAIAPGPTATAISGDFRSQYSAPLLEPFLALLPAVTTADKIAASIAWLLSDDSDNVNGQVIASDGGWSVQ